jgi:hypothetical protein
METRGVAMFAYNNDQLDYSKLAVMTALAVKANLKNNKTALLTDASTVKYAETAIPKDLFDYAFDTVVVEDIRHERNMRRHWDSPWAEFNSQFSNGNKHNVYNLTPFDKTLLIDVDYIVGCDVLDRVFDTSYDFSLYRNAHGLRNQSPHHEEQRLHPLGIDMWWSTVIYWQKTPRAKMFFDLWQHVKDNYDYYKFLYKFPNNLFRTDYASSIAIHIMNGQVESENVPCLPPGSMRYMDQKDNLVDIRGKNDFLFLSNYPQESWRNLAVATKNEDIHMMNKRALLRHYDKFLKHYYYG